MPIHYFFVFFVINTTNSSENIPTSANKTDKYLFDPSNYTFIWRRSLQTQTLTEAQYNVLVVRIRSFIQYLIDLMVEKQTPNFYRGNLMLQNAQSDNTNKNEITLIQYLKSFTQSEEFKVFLETGDLSYFDKLNYEINKLKKNKISSEFNNILRNIGRTCPDDSHIWYSCLGISVNLWRYLKPRQACHDRLLVISKIFYRRIQGIKKKFYHDNIGNGLDIFIEKYNRVCEGFEIKYNK